MDRYPSRRDMLVVLAGSGLISGGGLALLSQRGAADSHLSLSIENVSTETSDGTISDINLTGDSLLDLWWEGFDGTESPSITTLLRATDSTENDHLSSDAKSYEEILSSTYDISDGSDDITIGFQTAFDDETFPVSIVSRHSGLEITDFEPDAEGETETVELECAVDFESTTHEFTRTATDTYLVEVTYSESGAVISGTVVDDGTAVEGATVIIVDSEADSVEHVASTDTDGNYEVEVDTGIYHVMVQYEDSDGTVKTDQSKPFIEV